MAVLENTCAGFAPIVALSAARPSTVRDISRRSRRTVTGDCCRYLQSLLESAADSVAAIEPDGTIGFITPGLLSLFHETDPDRLIGRPWLSIWPGDCSDKLRAALDSALSGGAARCEIDCVDHEARHSWWEITLNPVKLRGSSVLGELPTTTVVAVARDVTDYHEAARKAEQLGHELHHRVRNMMSMVQAIVRIAATTSVDSASFIESIEGRVHAMARIHELLCQGNSGEVEVGALLRSELGPFANGNSIVIVGPTVTIREPRAAALALALHEITANAVKYGCLSTPSGRLAVTWALDEAEDRLTIEWVEQGGPAITDAGPPGFGSILLNQLLADQLSVERDWRPTGLAAIIRLTLCEPTAMSPLD